MHSDWQRNNRGMGLLKSVGLCLMMTLLAAGSDVVARAQNIHGHVLVRMQPQQNADDLSADYDTDVVTGTPSGSAYVLQTPADTDDATFARQISADPRVAYAVPDAVVGLPEFHGTQFHLAFDAGPNPGAYTNQTALQQVHVGRAWQKTTGAGAIVAVLDTGASFDHPALQGHYLPGYNAIDPTSPPNDVADVSSTAAVGHGTMVAGIIAQIAPRAMILPVRVLDSSGSGTLFTVLSGIDYAVRNGAQVINMSMGADQDSPILAAALQDAAAAGVLVVAAAGNDAATRVSYPAAYTNVLAVSSVDANNVKSSYANCGAKVAVVAPGTGIRSTYINQGYASWSGTSFSTPFVSAEAALIFSLHPDIEIGDVFGVIGDTAHSINRLNPLWKGLLGRGLIDIESAVLGDD